MSRNAQWLPMPRRRVPLQQLSQVHSHRAGHSTEEAALFDPYEAKYIFDTRRNRLAKNFLSANKRSCVLFWSRMFIPARWLPVALVLSAGVALTVAIWLSEEASLAGLPWPLRDLIPAPAATNAFLLLLAAASCALLAPHSWRSATAGSRPLIPLRAKTLIFFFWLSLNLLWFIEGIRDRDFRKPSWLQQHTVPSRAQHMGEPMLRLLRLMYGVGMASAWPLVANLGVVLLPVDRTLLLLAALGAGHEEGLRAHALCGTALWVWATAHALLTQAPMLATGLWRVIMLPPADGAETKAVRNFMGLLAFVSMCGLGISALATLRRRFFNAFQVLHLALAPAVLLFGCLHDKKVFWYCMLGAVLYGADLVQRWVLRRRAAVATATLYQLGPVPLPPSAALQGAGTLLAGSGGGLHGNKLVVLQIHTGCAPGCIAGQHVFVKVPAVSRWEWHPYSVAAHDDGSFALVVKAGGDWERRLCFELERRAAVEVAGAPCSTRLEVIYEGLYGTPDLQAAAAAADRVLLFAGGSGITPVVSVLQSLLGASLPPALPPPAAEQVAELPHKGTYVFEPSSETPLLNSRTGAGPFPRSGPGVGVAASPVMSGLAQDGAAATEANLLGTKSHPRDTQSGVCAAASPSGLGVWAAAGAPATVADAADAVAAAASSGARVHLVWAVTQQSDAQPLLPLLRAAAARGWRVDLHCTRLLPSSSTSSSEKPHVPAEAVTIVCSSGAHAAAGRTSIATSSSAAAAAAVPRLSATAASAVAPPPLPPRPPWQLHCAACWAVAALAALLGAAGTNFGSTVASAHSCRVVGAAAGAGSTSDWVTSVRLAFGTNLGMVADPGAEMAAAFISGPSWSRRILTVLLQGSSAPSVFRCPAALQPSGEVLHAVAAEATKAAAKAARKAFKAVAGEVVGLRVCRVWGGAAPELCVRCDPFKPPSSELERAWPCCQASVCFFAAELVPLVGWVVGVFLGAALACVIFRRWAMTRRDGSSGGRRPLLAARGARVGDRWFGEGDAEEAAARRSLLSDAAGHHDASSTKRGMEEGCSGGLDALLAGEAPGPEAVLAGADGTAQHVPEAKGMGFRSVFMHVGRPDVDAYIQAAVATGDKAGCGRYGKASACSDTVYGVVVCGPKSLQAAAEVAFERYVRKVYPGSWFRGFSFTT